MKWKYLHRSVTQLRFHLFKDPNMCIKRLENQFQTDFATDSKTLSRVKNKFWLFFITFKGYPLKVFLLWTIRICGPYKVKKLTSSFCKKK